MRLLLWLLSQVSVDSVFAWSASINSIFPLKGSYMPSRGDPLTASVLSGTHMAFQHCQQQFRWDRWNCPESAFLNEGRQPPTSEAAYVLAVMAAGVVHRVARNCSRGDLEGCGCGSSLQDHAVYSAGKGKTWTWRGCSDHLDYGERVAEHYLDSLVQGSDTNARIGHHNNIVGRQAVRASLRKHCKCHGLSGTCSIQTCWLQAASFTEIAAELRERYHHAFKLATINSIVSTNVKHIPKLNTATLVYSVDSPNYCAVNNITGWMGTRGRNCSKSFTSNATAEERRSCRNLCRSCGYRVRCKPHLVKWHCNCKFHWCCKVTCDTCSRIVEEYYCE